ncbi:MAG: hypothetical protein ACRD0Y_09720 [Terriglobales bacterium]
MNLVKKLILPLGLLIAFIAAMPALAAPALTMPAPSNSWTGWITDSKCGVKGASAAARACTQKCLAAGAQLVFVADGSHAVLTITNPARVKAEIGDHVRLSGQIDAADHSLTIAHVRALPR